MFQYYPSVSAVVPDGEGSTELVGLIQTKVVTSSGSTTLTLDATPTVGNKLILVAYIRESSGGSNYPATPTGFTVSKSAGEQNNCFVRIWYRDVTSSISASTSLNANNREVRFVMMEWTGLAEGQATATNTSGALNTGSYSCGSVTPTNPCLILGCMSVEGGPEVINVGSSYAIVEYGAANGGNWPFGVTIARIVAEPSGSYNPNFTTNGHTAGGLTVVYDAA